MAGENNETEGTEPKTFKDNFTDFAKNLGSSLNVFKQNVQQAISGVNTIAQNNKDAFSRYWAREDDSGWGKGEVLSNVYQLSSDWLIDGSSYEELAWTAVDTQNSNKTGVGCSWKITDLGFYQYDYLHIHTSSVLNNGEQCIIADLQALAILCYPDSPIVSSSATHLEMGRKTYSVYQENDNSNNYPHHSASVSQWLTDFDLENKTYTYFIRWLGSGYTYFKPSKVYGIKLHKI